VNIERSREEAKTINKELQMKLTLTSAFGSPSARSSFLLS